MSLWRSMNGSGTRPIRRTSKPAVERLDDRIVPDTTGVTGTGSTTPPNPNPPASTSTTTPGSTLTDPADSTSTTDPTGSTSTTGTTTGTTTTTTTTGTTGTTTTTTTTPTPQLYAVGSDANNAAQVIVYDNTGATKFNFIAYQNSLGGVHAAVGDVTGDGVPDIITGPGPGQTPTVKVFDGVSGRQVMSFDAYDKSFRGGVNIAIGDIDGDGRADIVTGAGGGGGSHVKVFSGAGLFPTDPFAAIQVAPGPHAYLIREFFAYDPKYLVGARVAVADVNGDGRDDIITAPNQNGGPHIRVFSGTDGTVYREWFAYDAKFTGGVFVAAGDLNGDGRAEVITGMGANGIGEVKVFDGLTNRTTMSFVPDSAGVRISSRIGVIDFDGDGDLDFMVANLNSINAYDGKTFSRIGGLTPFDPSHLGGMFFG
jgi:FG-GAP-like repeat/FG-GAP repeat